MPKQSKITALVINLESAKERLRFQQKQLDELGINYQRWQANSVENLTDNEYEKWANDWQRKLRRTEVACFLSHYRAWQYIVDNKKPFLILEDDALLSQHLPRTLLGISANKHIKYDHITFETRGRKKLIRKQGVDINNDVALHDLFLDKTGAAAYLLTPKGAKILIEQVHQYGAGLADALLCHTKILKSMQTVPALAIQMDMANAYDIPNVFLAHAAKSNISTHTHEKPAPKQLGDAIRFKARRLLAQQQLAIIQLAHRSESNYIVLKPNKLHFEYLENISY